ncbi:MAG: 30S ribosomal protein S8 [bacterium]|nr:30S ribosomal protein S8 [bacterium]
MDTIANMLTSIRNAQAVKKETVSVPYSKIKMEIANLLLKENFIKGAEHKGKKSNKVISINLKYSDDGQPAINGLKRISKPSKRVYVPVSGVRMVKSGYGSQILTTPKGILTNKEARREKVGGEVICEVW